MLKAKCKVGRSRNSLVQFFSWSLGGCVQGMHPRSACGARFALLGTRSGLPHLHIVLLQAREGTPRGKRAIVRLIWGGQVGKLPNVPCITAGLGVWQSHGC